MIIMHDGNIKLGKFPDKFKVKVKPNAKKTKITGIDEDLFIIAVAAVPDKNKANKELVKFLSKLLKNKVRIVSGKQSRIKIIEKI